MQNALSDQEINRCLENTVNELANRLKRNVVKNTLPYVPKHAGDKRRGGTLRRGWKTTTAYKSGNSFSADIYNNVYYAVYVEKGHRTRERKDGSRGWVEGKFMLERAEFSVKLVMDRVLKEKIDKLLKGAFK